jgi:fructokinase
MQRKVFGAIEAGGTKFVCGIGTGPDDVTFISIPTRTPTETLADAIAFFREAAGDRLQAVGIGSFGPVDLRRESPTFGCITSTPKAGWRDCDFAGAIRRALGVPVGFDTDVNAAAVGEGRWGAARELSDFLYLTVGTGIGGGAIVRHRVLHGLVHTELGHIPVPHDRARDPFPGCCPYHGDCLEGLASGPAMHARWGIAASELPPTHPAWDLEAHYLALGLAVWVCSLSPQRIVLGGGVMRQPHLFPLIRQELARILNGYVCAPELGSGIGQYVVPAELDGRAGILGALVLAEQAYT